MNRNEYKSIEEKVSERFEPMIKGVTRGLMGSVKIPFFIPSMIRKYVNNQTWLQRLEDSQINNKFLEVGAMVGVSLGLTLGYSLGRYVFDNNLNNDVLNLLILTNISSMTFEVFNSGKSLEEYKVRKDPVDYQI